MIDIIQENIDLKKELEKAILKIRQIKEKLRIISTELNKVNLK
ncbi:MAG: hypothetical protein ACP6IY_09505 [Promethearchaeia archaeon]